jgi:hypothetical protein
MLYIEARWLKYYGHRDTRPFHQYKDPDFYEKVVGIGYTKRVIPLWKRCCMKTITSTKPVMESTIEELRYADDQRDHIKNIYTPLEYVLYKRIGPYEDFKKLLIS